MPGKITFSTNAGGASVTPRVEIGSNGALKLLAGCPGIDFSGIQTNNAGMNSETLDSYEEGTWTPIIGEGSNIITTSGGHQVFRYTKIGNMVTVTFSLNQVTTSGTTGGAFIIGGLPFASANILQFRTIGTHVVYYGSGLRASNWPNMIHVGHNQTRADVYYKASATANYDRDTVASVGAATYFFWQVTYQVN